MANVGVPGHCGGRGRDSRTPLMSGAGPVSLLDICCSGGRLQCHVPRRDGASVTAFTSGMYEHNLNLFFLFFSLLLLAVMLKRMITKIIVLNIFLECLFTVFIAPLVTPRQVSGARGPGAGDPGLGVGA